MRVDLTGRTALVTGASRGIGRAIAERLAQAGATVCLNYRLQHDRAKETLQSLEASGAHVFLYQADVSDPAQAAGMVRAVVERCGSIDILVNNAGITVPRVPIEQTSAEHWDRVMAVNAKGVFLGTKHAIPAMRRAGGGSIVNISSIAGIGQSLQQEPAYATSKGAVRIFTKVTAAQHAKDRIRCNSIHPGPVDTDMIRGAFPDPKDLERRMARIPLGRMGTIAEIVAAVLYFASDDSGYTSGAELLIDGGAMAQ